MRFEEWVERAGQTIFLSATPGQWELEHSAAVVEQIVRPTGLIDPEVQVRPTKGQIDDLLAMINERVEVGERVLVTTLTKKMAEDLTDYLLEMGVRCGTCTPRSTRSSGSNCAGPASGRVRRPGRHQPAAGGARHPEVSLVAILDADKEGFLRSETSLIQMIVVRLATSGARSSCTPTA